MYLKFVLQKFLTFFFVLFCFISCVKDICFTKSSFSWFSIFECWGIIIKNVLVKINLANHRIPTNSHFLNVCHLYFLFCKGIVYLVLCLRSKILNKCLVLYVMIKMLENLTNLLKAKHTKCQSNSFMGVKNFFLYSCLLRLFLEEMWKDLVNK